MWAAGLNMNTAAENQPSSDDSSTTVQKRTGKGGEGNAAFSFEIPTTISGWFDEIEEIEPSTGLRSDEPLANALPPPLAANSGGSGYAVGRARSRPGTTRRTLIFGGITVSVAFALLTVWVVRQRGWKPPRPPAPTVQPSETRG
jgi:hypothetical protein